jgi:hypothetical protein
MTTLTRQLLAAMQRRMREALQAPLPSYDPCYALETHLRQWQPHDVEHCEVCNALFKQDSAYHTQQRAALARAILEPGGVRETFVVNPPTQEG